LSAIAEKHTFRDVHDPTKHPLVKGAKKAAQKRGLHPKQKKPITPQLIRRMIAAIKYDYIGIRDMTMIIIMTKGLLRESEATDLKIQDVQADDQGLLLIIRKSKTDQARKGTTVRLPPCQELALCPLQWHVIWMTMRGFTQSDWYFLSEEKTKLSRTTPAGRIKHWIKKIGEDESAFSSHSCRRGGATVAARNGLDVEIIKQAGRWRSNAVERYIDKEPSGEVAEMFNQ